MDALAQLLLGHACNNAWANHRLLVACAQLGFDEAGTWGEPGARAE